MKVQKWQGNHTLHSGSSESYGSLSTILWTIFFIFIFFNYFYVNSFVLFPLTTALFIHPKTDGPPARTMWRWMLTWQQHCPSDLTPHKQSHLTPQCCYYNPSSLKQFAPSVSVRVNRPWLHETKSAESNTNIILLSWLLMFTEILY